MSTWHQDQAMKRGGVKLYHETKWTLVVDPPNKMRWLVLHETQASAEAEKKMTPHSYVLRPASES
jgi:hypothetical protein